MILMAAMCIKDNVFFKCWWLQSAWEIPLNAIQHVHSKNCKNAFRKYQKIIFDIPNSLRLAPKSTCQNRNSTFPNKTSKTYLKSFLLKVCMLWSGATLYWWRRRSFWPLLGPIAVGFWDLCRSLRLCRPLCLQQQQKHAIVVYPIDFLDEKHSPFFW